MSEFIKQQPLILASGSAIRKKLLASLGLDFQVLPSQCDEEALKRQFCDTDWLKLGYLLAKEKALDVSHRFPDHYIIAADQLCLAGDRLYDKPLNHSRAVEHLKSLQGKEHQQIACLCLAKKGKLLWQSHEIATLGMRRLDEQTIEAYLRAEKPYHSCGAYQYETLGKWLFEQVQGDEDTILGLPLRPLTEALLSCHVVSL